MRYYILAFCLFTTLSSAQGDDKIILRYWNGAIGEKGIQYSADLGLTVSAKRFEIANAIERVETATLVGEPQNFYFKKKFSLFFKVENKGTNDVAIYDWAFKAICPVDNMGRRWDAGSMVELITPYIPGDIYLVMKPGDVKIFFSGITDFFWCLPGNKKDLLEDPKYFQARMTCAAIYGSGNLSPNNSPASGSPAPKTGKSKPAGNFNPPLNQPQKAGSGFDPEFDKLIDQHNNYIEKNDNKNAEALKKRILEIGNELYPTQLKLIESKLLKPKTPVKTPGKAETSSRTSTTKKSTLTFNGKAIEAEGECLGITATLIGTDESSVLVLNNLGSNGSFSVNSDFYTGACTDCLAVQFQDINNTKTYIAVSGTVKKTAHEITIDVTMKDMVSLIEGGGGSYRVTGKIACE